jgi:hypothetical protein
MSEKDYIMGSRSAACSILRECLSILGYSSPEAMQTSWILEREAAINALRCVCNDYGDNDWDEKLHLADIVDKHLARNLRRANA